MNVQTNNVKMNRGAAGEKMKQIIADRELYLIMLPFVLFYIFFVFKPMGGLVIAFKDYSVYKGIKASPWVGFDNFALFLKSPYLVRIFRNTLLISGYGLLFGFPAPILLALCLNELRCRKFKSFVQTCTYLPYFISAVVAAGLVSSLLAPSNGLVNIIIEKLGGEKIYFLSQAKYFRTIYTIMGIWMGLGYNSIVYIAALSGVDVQLYEACTIDGGGKLRQVWHITLPGIMPTIVTMLIINIGNVLNVNYETIILLYQPATYETADVINSFVYRMGIEKMNYSLSTAVGMLNSVIGFFLVIIANTVSNKVNETGLW